MSLKKKIKNWDDQRVLEHLVDLMKERGVTAGVRFIESPEDPLILGYQSIIVCGDLMLPAEPVMFEWPMQYLPIPDAFKDKNPKEIN